ncbi:MAG: hypothetical protein FJX61_01755 [Alphaproteobacteria bacterium]|nr:hypothetical protein [Alphaproteobacteria bacterium]
MPHPFVPRAGLNEGSAVEITESDGALVVRKLRYRLDDRACARRYRRRGARQAPAFDLVGGCDYDARRSW